MSRKNAKKASSRTDNPPFAVPEWPATHVEMRKRTALAESPHNARIHSAEQIEHLRTAIREFGFTIPILVDERDIILAGHARLRAAALDAIEQVPVIVARGWSEKKKRAYIEADNRLAELAGWDEEARRRELAFLQAQGFPLEALGWTQSGLEEFLAVGTRGMSDPDEVLEPPAVPIVRSGDLWQLGKHRLLCGDSTKQPDVARLIGKDLPLLMVTDPPYGVSYDPNWRNEPEKLNATSNRAFSKKTKVIGQVVNDHRSDWTDAWSLFPGDVVYTWCGERQSVSMAKQLESCDFILRNLIVWAKPRLVISRGNYHSQHETCWYAVRKGKTAHWSGDRKQSTVWAIDQRQENAERTGHGTQKPVECMRRPIENNSRRAAFVYEPFAGSGTTIIAAEMTGRYCLAVEIDPGYAQVCVERWQKFTGEVATLDGVAFNRVAESRRAASKRGKGNATRRAGKPVRGKGIARADQAVSQSKIRAALPAPQLVAE